MEQIYSHEHPPTYDVKRLSGKHFDEFNFFIVSTPQKSITIEVTNNMAEIFHSPNFRKNTTHILCKNSDGSLAEINKRNIVKEKLESMTKEQQYEIFLEMAIDKMLGKA